jgi:predicted 3-demethylubiquinone-9 3-methyltransferase (glyoxalase superfamily)
MCIDSPIKHDFSFTPAVSLFVICEDEDELVEAFNQLSSDGSVLMPLDNYDFSRKFGWLNDRYGVSWQLNLE